MLVLAHAGHWAIDLLIYGSPVILGIIALKYVDKKARAEDREDEEGESSRVDEAPVP